MGKMDVHYSSATGEWGTPPELFEPLHKLYKFTIDLAASKANAKLPKFYSKQDDALAQKWTGRCWMNPPFGRGIGEWVEKARTSVFYGQARLVCCVLPARPDTAWWQDFVMQPYGALDKVSYHGRDFSLVGLKLGLKPGLKPGNRLVLNGILGDPHIKRRTTTIRFLRGRVHFLMGKGRRFPAPFPSAIVTFAKE